MFSWEKKLVEFFDKWLLEIVFVIITLAAIFIRREGLWHMSFDYQQNFYVEMPNYLHTSFYSLFIWLISFIPITPIRMLKIILSGADILLGILGICFLDKIGKGKITRLQKLGCYALLLISPLSIESGLVWLHTDVICLCILLLAALRYGKKDFGLVVVLLGFAGALQGQYFVVIMGILAYIVIRNKKNIVWCLLYLGSFAVFSLLGIVWAGISISEGFCAIFNWLFISPATGVIFESIGYWILTMIVYAGYGLGMGTVLYAFYKPKRWWIAVMIHVPMLLWFGYILQKGVN